MLIIHGEKYAFRNAGRVAEFCYFCREVRACRLIRIGITSHVYFISFGEGRLAGHKLRCETCGGWWMVNASHYPTILQDRHASLSELIAQTHPNVETCCGPLLELERKIRRRQALDRDLRQSLLEERFVLLDADLAKGGDARSFDWWAASSLFAALALMVIGGLITDSAGRDPAQERLGETFFMLAFIAFALFIGLLATNVRRYIRRRTLPLLSRALSPLDPTQS